MNDQHPHAGYAGYDSPSTGGFETDPLFGNLPGQHDSSHETTYGGGYAPAYEGGYDSGRWDTGAHQQASYDAYDALAHPQAPQGYETTGTWMTEAGPPALAPAPDATGQWDTAGWDLTGQADQWAAGDTGAFPTTTFDTTAYATGTFTPPAFEAAAHGSYASADTGAYDATAWNTGATPENAAYAPEQTSHPSYEHQSAPYEPYASAEFASHEDVGHDPQHSPGSHDHAGYTDPSTPQSDAYTDTHPQTYDEFPGTGLTEPV
ncbi:MAG TPA: M23 family peptidase, partial [Streptomyces sp.]|nr:M23 family peptidase [Streptomyces sp.]